MSDKEKPSTVTILQNSKLRDPDFHYRHGDKGIVSIAPDFSSQLEGQNFQLDR